MSLNNLFANAKHKAKVNSPTILSAFAVSGVAGTAYLVGKASWLSAEQVMYAEADLDEHMDTKERARLVWKNYIPSAVSGVATVVCIVGAQRAGAKKTAAAQAAFTLSERAFAEYRDKVVETIGAGQEQKIRDAVKQDHVDNHPPAVVIGGNGVMCREDLTGRYFTSDMETLRKACNDINHRMANGVYATLSDLYDILDLDHTSESDYQGWKVGKPLEFEFSTAIFRGDPVLVFSYNYLETL